MDDAVMVSRANSTLENGIKSANTTLDVKKEFEKSIEILHKCAFKCEPFNEPGNNLTMCLDENLMCDNEVDCVYNNSDEINCKFLEVLSK